MSIELNGTTGITTPAETVSGAVTAATVTATGLISGATNYTGFKNRIINGNMAIDQRKAGASVTPADGVYTLDRFTCRQTTASKFSVQQNAGAVTPPAGFSNYLGITSLSAFSIGAGDIFQVAQNIEGLNTYDLAWGTASASTVTLSFWVRSSLTGTFGGVLKNSDGSRSYPYTYTISAANTWEQKTVTIVGETTGTWLTTNGIGMQVIFGLGVGATYSGTAGAWASASLNSATGATSVVGTNGATFYITGVQLEKGSTATSFDYRPYGTELALCQRYYYRKSSVSTTDNISVCQAYSTSAAFGKLFEFPVTMRTSPTASISSYTHVGAVNASGSASTAFSSGSLSATTTSLNASDFAGSSGIVAGNATVIQFKSASGWLDASSEL